MMSSPSARTGPSGSAPTRKTSAPQQRGEATRARIIAETVRCILDEGFGAATAKHVADRAGVTWGVIQYHFGDRNGLLMAVVEAGVAELLTSLSAVDVGGLELRQRVEAVVDTAWRCYASPTSMAAFEILHGSRGRLGDASRRHLLEMNDAIGELGRLISGDPRNTVVAEVIWSALRGVVLTQLMIGVTFDWDVERRTLIEMVNCYLEH